MHFHFLEMASCKPEDVNNKEDHAPGAPAESNADNMKDGALEDKPDDKPEGKPEDKLAVIAESNSGQQDFATLLELAKQKVGTATLVAGT